MALNKDTQHLQRCSIGFVGDCTLTLDPTPILLPTQKTWQWVKKMMSKDGPAIIACYEEDVLQRGALWTPAVNCEKNMGHVPWLLAVHTNQEGGMSANATQSSCHYDETPQGNQGYRRSREVLGACRSLVHRGSTKRCPGGQSSGIHGQGDLRGQLFLLQTVGGAMTHCNNGGVACTRNTWGGRQ